MAGDLRTVSNALRTLAALADAEAPLAVTELAGRLNLAPSTTHRILATLVRSGYATRIPSNRRYRPGPFLTALARPSRLEHSRLADAGRATLRRLAADTGETCHLAVLEGGYALSLDHADGSQAVIAHHPVGSRVAAHASAVGHALLAYYPEVVSAIVAEGLEALTTATITDPAAFERELAEVRRRGYALNLRQLHPETAGVAAPVFDSLGTAVASVGISGPAGRIGRSTQLTRLGRLTVDAAASVSEELTSIGGRETPPLSAAAPHR